LKFNFKIKLNKLYLKVSLVNIIMSSDDESSYNSSSDSEVELTSKNKKPLNLGPTIEDEDEDEVENIVSDDSDEESHANSESEEEEDFQIGGANSDVEEGEIVEEENEDEDGEIEEGENEDEEGEIEGTKSVKQPKPTKGKINIQPILDDDDEDDEYDENYLQKFDSEITKNYIADFHPECFNHNYEEITKLSTVVRNNDNIIIDPLHQTIPFLTKYEKTRILGQRAKQIEMGAKPFVNVDEKIVDSYIIAELELRDKKIPFIIKRPLPSGGFEYWYVKDLEIIY